MGCAGRVANGINTVHLSYVREKTGHALGNVAVKDRQVWWIPERMLAACYSRPGDLEEALHDGVFRLTGQDAELAAEPGSVTGPVLIQRRPHALGKEKDAVRGTTGFGEDLDDGGVQDPGVRAEARGSQELLGLPHVGDRIARVRALAPVRCVEFLLRAAGFRGPAHDGVSYGDRVQGRHWLGLIV
jgi:hypothetical protein